MPKLGPIDGKDLIRIFEKVGYRKIGGKGSHVTMQRKGSPRPIVIQANKKDLPDFIISNNIKIAGMTREKYFRLRSEL